MLLYYGCTPNGAKCEFCNNFTALCLRICLCCFLVVLHLSLKEIFKQDFFLSKQEETADQTIFMSHMSKMLLAAEIEESSKKCVGEWCDSSLCASI